MKYDKRNGRTDDLIEIEQNEERKEKVKGMDREKERV